MAREGEHIRQRAHYVDIIFGPQNLANCLPEMINPCGDRSPVVDISFPKSKSSTVCRNRAQKARPLSFLSWKAAINIALTGAVPYTRGEEVSRPSDDILSVRNRPVSGGRRA